MHRLHEERAASRGVRARQGGDLLVSLAALRRGAGNRYAAILLQIKQRLT